MKINLEVELDEQMNLDETVKQSIINGVVNKIREKNELQIQAAVDKLIGETTVNKINELTENLFNDFMQREVILTDGYGSKLKVYENVEAVIKERFDNFMTQKVDEKGNICTSSYGKSQERISYIIDKQLRDFATAFTTDAVKKVSAEIQLHVKEGLTQKLGSELMKVLKVEQLLKLQ